MSKSASENGELRGSEKAVNKQKEPNTKYECT